MPFYDTDAMAIVHHANYVRYLELVRVRFLKDHDQPYVRYVEQGYHVVVTRVDIRLRTPTRFDEELTVTGWLERVRNVDAVVRLSDHVRRAPDRDRGHRARRGRHAG